MKRDDYEDILRLPRPCAHHHLPMERAQRAAMFAPFAALTGLDARMEVAEELHAQGGAAIAMLLERARRENGYRH